MASRFEFGVHEAPSARPRQATNAEPHVNVNRIHKQMLRLSSKEIERKCVMAEDL